MFKKINNVFRPNHHGHKGRDGGFRSEQDYHNACTVRLVRSTSMLVVGEKTQTAVSSTLKRSKSTVSIESTLYYYQRQEDRIWLYSQNQNCLEYLEELVALRRQYTKSVNNLKSKDTKATVSSKKKPAPPPPTKDTPVSKATQHCVTAVSVLWLKNWDRSNVKHIIFPSFKPQISGAKPSAPPIPNVEDTLQFFDAVIASCDNEPLCKPHRDDGHADVDFIGELEFPNNSFFLCDTRS